MHSPIRFGIVGCGNIAQRHAAHIHAKGQLVAVCDIIPEKSQALAAVYGVKAYHDYKDMLEGAAMDVVVVCTPNGLHAPHSIAAFETGFHVLCEKPMAIKIADCALMIAAAEKASRQLFVVKQNRYNPPVAQVKKIVEEGRLGKILSVQLNCFWNRGPEYYTNSWKGTLDMDGGTLFTQFSHFIDLLYWMVGDVKQVQAMITNSNHQGMIEFEDSGSVMLSFNNGAIGNIHYTVNSYQKNMEGSLTLFGEKGTVKIGGQYLNELEYQCIQDYAIAGLPEGNPPNEYGNYTGSMSNHGLVYDNLIEVLLHGGKMATSSFEAMKTVELIERIYKAAIRVKGNYKARMEGK